MSREELLTTVSTWCARPINDFRDLTPMEVEAICRLAYEDASLEDRRKAATYE